MTARSALPFATLCCMLLPDARGHWWVYMEALVTCANVQIGAWMIQTHLGRKKSLAICTLATGLAVFVFIRVRSDLTVILSSMFISLTGTAMYAVLCEYLFWTCKPGVA